MAIEIISGIGGKASLITLEILSTHDKNFPLLRRGERLRDEAELRLASTIGDINIIRRKYGTRENDKRTH
jgi:hypothetical protein